MTHKIVLVDDDKNILTSIRMALESEGFFVKSFPDPEVGLKNLLNEEPDVAIIDIKMPRLNGIDLLKKLREKSNVPVIFLTSKDSEIDELLGLKIGADDYITKPFSQKILVERIRILIGRNKKKKETKGAKETNKNTLTIGNLLLDKDKHLCKWKAKLVNLTVTEFLILESLATNPGIVKSREQLMNSAFGEETNNQDDRSIDHHLKRIRKKFKKTDNKFNFITTIYGIGYKFSE
tara:strand:+ start:3859 stop:4563 length:705 start_codon:yes stop_codon:yes gene_type:complete